MIVQGPSAPSSATLVGEYHSAPRWSIEMLEDSAGSCTLDQPLRGARVACL